MSSLSCSTGSGLAPTLENTEMGKLWECPVCIEIMVQPIYICETGHSICNICKSKLKKCTICKRPYTNSRNFTLEATIQAAKFYCNQRPNGCIVMGRPDELVKHHKVCTFGPIKCIYTNYDVCNGPVLYMPDYKNHLKDVHKLGYIRHEENRHNTFVHGYYIPRSKEETFKKNLKIDWVPRLLKYEDKWFISHLSFRDSSFFLRCVIIGEETEAAKYAVKVVICNDSNPKVQIPRFSLTTMIESLRDVSENPDRLPLTVIQKDLMVRLGTLSSTGAENQPQLSGKIKYKIIKLPEEN